MKKVSESFDHISPENQRMGLARKYNALVDEYEELKRKYSAATAKPKSKEKADV